jgi:hypothetical protein
MTTYENQKPVILEGGQPFKTITIRWKQGLKMPVIRGKWQRLDDERIQAVYTRDDLRVCLEVFEAIQN